MKLFCPEVIARWPESRPARGAWIEIQKPHGIELPRLVAPRKGRVD